MIEKSYMEAVAEGHRQVLADIDESFVIGEDVEPSFLGATAGLVEEFGQERVRDTPISEAGFTGLGIGAAVMGKRPIVEYQINTAAYVAMDQLVNQAQKLSHMSGGDISVPLTLTVPMAGAPGALAGQHSDNPWPALLHFGLKTVVPTTPYDAKGLFRSAVEEDDPVVVFFPTVLGSKTGDVPDNSYSVPLGVADVKREGSDVTVVAVGEAVETALSVADDLEGELSLEVIDPRTLLPLDEETIVDSVAKTGRVVVVENANRPCGFAAEIASRIANIGFWHLDAPVKRVTRAQAVPVPFSPPQEEAVLVDESVLTEAVRAVSDPEYATEHVRPGGGQ